MPKLELVCQLPEDQKHEADVEAVRVFGDKVYSCADDGKVKVFDKNLKQLHEFKAHDYAVYDIMVLDGTLFTAGIDSTVKAFDANTYEPKGTVGEHEEAVRKFCTDGKLCYAGDEKGAVKGYDKDGNCKVTYNVVEEVWGLYAEGDLLYSIRDRGLTIQTMKGQDNKLLTVSCLEGRSPIYISGDWLVFPDTSGMTLQVHENKAPLFKLKGTISGSDMIITTIGGWDHYVVSSGYGNTIRLWDLTTMKQLDHAELPEMANSVKASPEGDIYVGGSGGFVYKYKVV